MPSLDSFVSICSCWKQGNICIMKETLRGHFSFSKMWEVCRMPSHPVSLGMRGSELTKVFTDDSYLKGVDSTNSTYHSSVLYNHRRLLTLQNNLWALVLLHFFLGAFLHVLCLFPQGLAANSREYAFQNVTVHRVQLWVYFGLGQRSGVAGLFSD